MGDITCSIDECPGEVVARGLCGKHYQRQAKLGDLAGPPVIPCAYCGERFRPRRRDQRYCSRPCKVTAGIGRRPKPPPRGAECQNCGAPFTSRKTTQKYCSPACQVANNRAEHQAKRESARIRVRECPGCLAKFEPMGRQKFCSRQCQSRLWQRTRLGIADPGLIGTCWWCHDEFSLLDGRRLYCSAECARFVRSLWNLSRYGITRDDYRDAWYAQDGKCAICRQPERTARNHLLSIDHDHVTGRFRGLLCSHCNRAIGLLRDDPEVIEAAARYVRS